MRCAAGFNVGTVVLVPYGLGFLLDGSCVPRCLVVQNCHDIHRICGIGTSTSCSAISFMSSTATFCCTKGRRVELVFAVLERAAPPVFAARRTLLPPPPRRPPPLP